jgi:hypothetical protein
MTLPSRKLGRSFVYTEARDKASSQGYDARCWVGDDGETHYAMVASKLPERSPVRYDVLLAATRSKKGRTLGRFYTEAEARTFVDSLTADILRVLVS